MKEKFIAIYNILSMIETKGEYTMMMADCLRFIAQCAQECDDMETAQTASQDESK